MDTEALSMDVLILNQTGCFPVKSGETGVSVLRRSMAAYYIEKCSAGTDQLWAI